MDFLNKVTAGLPNWAWGVVIVAGLAAAYVVPKLFPGASSNQGTTTATDQTTTASGVPNYAAGIDQNTGLPLSGGYPSGGALPTTQVGGNQVPIVPSGYHPVFDGNGNLIGYQQNPPDGGLTGGGGGTQVPPPTGGGGGGGSSTPVGTTIPNGSHVYFGGGGRVWYVQPGGTQQLLTGPGGGLLPANTFISYGSNGQIFAQYGVGGPKWLLTTGVQGPPSTSTPSGGTTAKYVSVGKWPNPTSTLSGIASANGISLQRLEQLNPAITNPNQIQPGQQVRVA